MSSNVLTQWWLHKEVDPSCIIVILEQTADKTIISATLQRWLLICKTFEGRMNSNNMYLRYGFPTVVFNATLV